MTPEEKELAENEAEQQSTTRIPLPLRYLLIVSKEEMIAEIEELWYQREMLRKMLSIEDQELYNAQQQADKLASLVCEMSDSDAWMEKATSFMANGGCPVCFSDDKGGHNPGCEWGDQEAHAAVMQKALHAVRFILAGYADIQLNAESCHYIEKKAIKWIDQSLSSTAGRDLLERAKAADELAEAASHVKGCCKTEHNGQVEVCREGHCYIYDLNRALKAYNKLKGDVEDEDTHREPTE